MNIITRYLKSYADMFGINTIVRHFKFNKNDEKFWSYKGLIFIFSFLIDKWNKRRWSYWRGNYFVERGRKFGISEGFGIVPIDFGEFGEIGVESGHSVSFRDRFSERSRTVGEGGSGWREEGWSCGKWSRGWGKIIG